MSKTYWRVNYNGLGIYDAFKKELWKKSENPQKEWEKLKLSDAFLWLKVPNIHYENCYSYFTELGYKRFKMNTYPTFMKYLDEEKVVTDVYNFDVLELDIIYQDAHQIVIKQ